jgi:FkbM family methyltransferase
MISIKSLLGSLSRSGNTIPRGMLEDIVARANLKLVDIGARGGSQAPLRLLAPYAHYYACEPNHEEALALPAKLKADALWRGITIIPSAISKNEGTATLNITRQPGLSSLLVPDYSAVRKFHIDGHFDIQSTSTVTTIPLDGAAKQYTFTDACFLKIDTQGSELNILKSGEKLLTESIIGIHIEVFFRPFYVGQPYFADIDSYLREFGFLLSDIEVKTKRRTGFNKQVASRPQPVWANALFIKEPEIAVSGAADEQAVLKVSQLFSLSLAYEQFDLALELVAKGRPAQLIGKYYGDGVHARLLEYLRYRKRGKSP